MKKKERIGRIVNYLYWNGQRSITQISRDLNIPKSTVFDYMQEIGQKYDFVMVRRG